MKIQEFFKKGFYINLDHRTDRKLEFENEMKSVGLDGFLERIPGIVASPPKPHETIGRTRQIACSKVHKSIIQLAKDNDYDNVLIFEDDAQFYNENGILGIEIIEKALDDLVMFDDWDMFFFSALIIDDELYQVSENLLKPNVTLTGHAYGVNKKAYDRILQQYNPEVDSILDGWYGQQADSSGVLGSKFKKYVAYPLSMHQRHSRSDIDLTDDGIPSMGHGMDGYFQGYSKKINKLF